MDFAKLQRCLEVCTPLRLGRARGGSREAIVSRNPAKPNEVVGRVEAAGQEDVETAIAMAASTASTWSNTPNDERAEILQRAGELLRQQRFELAALEVFETGKTWAEADADVCEAIDFCRYHAGEMLRLSNRRLSIPGEEIRYDYIARGVTAVIAPWNFPLAILCGMTTAALVAGNPVVMKPSGQSAVIATVFARVLYEAGVPANALHCLPGSGRRSRNGPCQSSRSNPDRIYRLARSRVAHLGDRRSHTAWPATSEESSL